MRIQINKLKDYESLKNWTDQINERMSEAIETLKEENIQEESMYVFEIDGQKYALTVLVAKPGETIYPPSAREINLTHTATLEKTLGETLLKELMYNIKNV